MNQVPNRLCSCIAENYLAPAQNEAMMIASDPFGVAAVQSVRDVAGPYPPHPPILDCDKHCALFWGTVKQPAFPPKSGAPCHTGQVFPLFLSCTFAPLMVKIPLKSHHIARFKFILTILQRFPQGAATRRGIRRVTETWFCSLRAVAQPPVLDRLIEKPT